MVFTDYNVDLLQTISQLILYEIQKCSKKEGIGRMKTTIACMEREYFEDYFSEIADSHE